MKTKIILVSSLLLAGICILVLRIQVFTEKPILEEREESIQTKEVEEEIKQEPGVIKEEELFEATKEEGYYANLYLYEDFFSDQEGGQLRLELIQAGKRSVVFNEYVKAADFPRTFQIEGDSEEMGVVEVFIEDKKTETVYTISFVENK